MPARETCPRCHNSQWGDVDSLEGTVVEATKVSRSFGGDVDPAQPYALIEVKAGGFRLTRNTHELAIGTPVTVDQAMNIIPSKNLGA
jgi:uncharacterized OB-fold protein